MKIFQSNKTTHEMANEQLTNEQVDRLIKGLKESTLHSDAEKWRLTQYYDACRPDKSNGVKLATEEELDAVMGRLMPEYPNFNKGEKKSDAPKSDMDKILDEMVRHL